MPYSSLHPSVVIPSKADLWTLLFNRKQKPFLDTKEILVDVTTARAYTYADTRQTALEFGSGLKALWDWKKGDVMAFYTPNSIDTIPTCMGVLWAGGVVSPANPAYTVEELAFQLKDSGAKALITQLPLAEVALAAAREAGIPEERIILIGDQHDGDDKGRFRHFTSIRSTSYTGHYAKTKINPKKDLAFLVYSSGTTGMPKGVCLSHRNMVANLIQFSTIEGKLFFHDGGPEGTGDKQLGILPIFHVYGLVCVGLMPLYLGWTVIMMERFDMQKALQAVQDYKITFMYIPPPIVLAFGKHPLVDKYDLTSLKVLHSAAAPLTRELTEAVWDRLKIPVKQGFGLSETSPVSHTQTTDEWAKFMGSVGRLVPNMEAKIVDDDGLEVEDGEPGELWLKGPNVFVGYLNQPEKTKDTFSEDGYFKTGDIFRRDKYGNFYCVDRLKELIKYKGFQVPPAELEGILVSHNDISDACVIGVENREEATEVPRAYIVLRPGVEPCEEKENELVEWIAGQVARHKKLRGGIKFVDEIPKSAAGKILRRVVRDQARKEDRTHGARL
ncbi:acetyl-CoA synthetase-like protein [Thozetella sp. PMI_491]|nr:acetyl-CoA synthetase-like protein [Thozetella sp. PMI_491]